MVKGSLSEDATLSVGLNVVQVWGIWMLGKSILGRGTTGAKALQQVRIWCVEGSQWRVEAEWVRWGEAVCEMAEFGRGHIMKGVVSSLELILSVIRHHWGSRSLRSGTSDWTFNKTCWVVMWWINCVCWWEVEGMQELKRQFTRQVCVNPAGRFGGMD